MSGGISATAIATIAAAVIGAGTAVYTSDQNRKAQHQAQDKAEALANKPGPQQTKTATRQIAGNRAAAASSATNGANGALGGTLLTGSQGVSSGSLNLGSNTLLGG